MPINLFASGFMAATSMMSLLTGHPLAAGFCFLVAVYNLAVYGAMHGR